MDDLSYSYLFFQSLSSLIFSVHLLIAPWFFGMSTWTRSFTAFANTRLSLSFSLSLSLSLSPPLPPPLSLFVCFSECRLSDAVMCVAFNSEGNYLASGSTDGKVIVWNVQVCVCVRERERLREKEKKEEEERLICDCRMDRLWRSSLVVAVCKRYVLSLFLFLLWFYFLHIFHVVIIFSSHSCEGFMERRSFGVGGGTHDRPRGTHDTEEVRGREGEGRRKGGRNGWDVMLECEWGNCLWCILFGWGIFYGKRGMNAWFQ